MKQAFMMLVLFVVSNTAFATSPRMCGMGGMTMFNPQNVYECVTTLNTCETSALLEQGWMTSANGKCAVEPQGMQICGMGGSDMKNPNDPSQVINVLNTCTAGALRQMGWVDAQ